MTTNVKKSLEDYIDMAIAIATADDEAVAEGYEWAFVPVFRTEFDTLSADLQSSTTAALNVQTNYDEKQDEKDNYDKDTETALNRLKVYILTAFRSDADLLTHRFHLDEDYPVDDEKARLYLKAVLDEIEQSTMTEPGRFPSP